MALPASGAISMLDVAGEFGGATPHSISEYYSAASGVPASGTISLSDFHGTSGFSLISSGLHRRIKVPASGTTFLDSRSWTVQSSGARLATSNVTNLGYGLGTVSGSNNGASSATGNYQSPLYYLNAVATISVWVNIKTNQSFCTGASSSPYYCGTMFTVASATSIAVYIGDTANANSNSRYGITFNNASWALTNANNAGWHQIIITYHAANKRPIAAFVNGVKHTSTSDISGNLLNNKVWEGYYTSNICFGNWQSWNGYNQTVTGNYFADYREYNRTISDAEAAIIGGGSG